MRLRATALLAVAAVSAFLAAPAAVAAPVAHLANYPPTVCSTLSVSTTNPLPGATITVSGTNFTPDAGVRIELHTTIYVLKTVTADASGSFSTEVTLPAGVTGTHQIVAATGAIRGANCPGDPFVTIHIQTRGLEGSTAANPGGNGHGTAFTGVDILLLVAVAALLVGAGYAFNRGGRRRHGSAARH
jgi:hypothetical protein